MKTRILASILIVSMFALCFGGCSPSDNSGESDAPDQASKSVSNSPDETEPVEATEAPSLAVSLPLTEEPVVFTIVEGSNPVALQYIESHADMSVWAELSVRTGVYFDSTLLHPMSAGETWSLFIASSEYPDIGEGFINYYQGGSELAIENGVIVNISDYLDIAPNVQYQMDRDEEIAKTFKTDSGYIPAFIRVFSEAYPAEYGGSIRADWLEALELDIPQTYDDYYKILTAFKSEYNATLLLQFSGQIRYHLLVGGYGVAGWENTGGDTWDPFYQVDGVVKAGMVQPEYKDYLTMMNQWYDDGLIHEMFVNEDNYQNPTVAYIESGEAGIWYSTLSVFHDYEKTAADTAFSTRAIPDPVLNLGDEIHFSGTQGQLAYVQKPYSVFTKCSDPELAIRLFDYMYSDDGSFLCNWGIQGKTFEYDENGNPQFTEFVTNNPDGISQQNIIFMHCIQNGPYVEDVYRSEPTYSDAQLEARSVWAAGKDNSYDLPSSLSLTSEENEEYNVIISDIVTYCKENVVKFITGARSLDEYDAYVEELNDMNLERCIQLKQEAYDRYLLR